MKALKFFLLSTAALSVFTSGFIGINIEKAKAENCWVWESCWDDPPPPPRRTSYSINIRNSCYRKIYVALGTYFPGREANTRLSYEAPIPAGWDYGGFWAIEPGQTAFIKGGQTNRYFFYYAETDEKQTVWEGNASSGVVRGRYLSFRQADTGSKMEDYTLQLNCN